MGTGGGGRSIAADENLSAPMAELADVVKLSIEGLTSKYDDDADPDASDVIQKIEIDETHQTLETIETVSLADQPKSANPIRCADPRNLKELLSTPLNDLIRRKRKPVEVLGSKSDEMLAAKKTFFENEDKRSNERQIAEMEIQKLRTTELELNNEEKRLRIEIMKAKLAKTKKKQNRSNSSSSSTSN